MRKVPALLTDLQRARLKSRAQLIDVIQASGRSRAWWAQVTGLSEARIARWYDPDAPAPTQPERWIVARAADEPVIAETISLLPPPSAAEIRALQQRLGMHGAAMSRFLLVGRAVYHAWQAGNRRQNALHQRITHWQRYLSHAPGR